MNPAQPPHGRKLGLLATDLVKAPKIRHDINALKATRDQIEQILVESAYLKDAPFSWVTVSIRFGLKNEDKPHYEKINKRYGDLPLAIEVDTHELLDISLEQLTLKFKAAVLKALIHAGKKFKRPTEQLEVELVKLND